MESNTHTQTNRNIGCIAMTTEDIAFPLHCTKVMIESFLRSKEHPSLTHSIVFVEGYLLTSIDNQ